MNLTWYLYARWVTHRMTPDKKRTKLITSDIVCGKSRMRERDNLCRVNSSSHLTFYLLGRWWQQFFGMQKALYLFTALWSVLCIGQMARKTKEMGCISSGQCSKTQIFDFNDCYVWLGFGSDWSLSLFSRFHYYLFPIRKNNFAEDQYRSDNEVISASLTNTVNSFLWTIRYQFTRK